MPSLTYLHRPLHTTAKIGWGGVGSDGVQLGGEGSSEQGEGRAGQGRAGQEGTASLLEPSTGGEFLQVAVRR